MNFRYKLMQFMSGRYGSDEIFYILFTVSITLSVVNIFVRSIIIQLIIYAIIIFAVFRMFSRNIEARRRENTWIMSKVGFFKKKKAFNDQKKADRCHVYKKCPACKAILRLPRRIGVHKTVCPKCGREFTVKVKK